MTGYCRLEDAFPGFNKEKKTKNNIQDPMIMNNADNINLSKRIEQLEKREVIRPDKPVNVPLDEEVNTINKKLFEELDQKYKSLINDLLDEMKTMKDDIKTKEKTNLIEGFGLGIQSDQFNELMLYVCTCIFFIFMFDYMFSFGKRSY